MISQNFPCEHALLKLFKLRVAFNGGQGGGNCPGVANFMVFDEVANF